jgi:hypothetical protein
MFSVRSTPRLHNEDLRQLRKRKKKASVEAGSNTSTAALRVVGGLEYN